MLERNLENKLRVWCKKNNYLFYKFTSPARRGVPDRIAISPRGGIGFIELKRKGNRPTGLQAKEILTLQEQNCRAEWFDDYETAVAFLKTL